MEIFKYIIILSLMIGSQSFAGNEGGGGVGFLCENKVYLADTYHIMKDQAAFYEENYKEMNVDQIVLDAIEKADAYREIINESLKKIDSSQIESIQRLMNAAKHLNSLLLKTTYSKLSFHPKSEVPFAGDDKIKNVPKGCKKIPIAYQKISEARVDYSKSYYAGLSKFDKAYLRLHEVLIQIENGISDTTSIRNSIELITGLTGIGKFLENESKKCDLKKYISRSAVITLRELHISFYDVDVDKYSDEKMFTGKLNSKNILVAKMTDYIQPKDFERFIEESYSFLIMVMSLINKQDIKPYPQGELWPRLKRHYMEQSRHSVYSEILLSNFNRMTVCEYTKLVDTVFKIDTSRPLGKKVATDEY